MHLSDYCSMEYVCAVIHGLGVKVLVMVVYRPPSSAIGEFLDDFSDVLERTTHYSSVVIVGDLNLHLDVKDDLGVMKFESLLAENNYVQHCVCGDTRRWSLARRRVNTRRPACIVDERLATWRAV